MSVETTMHVLDRTMREEAFLDAFRTDPEAALAPYDLTDEAAAALASGDESRVRDYLGEVTLATAVAVIVISI